MDELFEKLAKLKELYPDEVEQIEQEEHRVSDLLQKQEYYQNPETQQLISLCRKDIVTARTKLAMERKLPEDARTELWHIIEARGWFLQMVVKDYQTELENIEQQLEFDLSV